MTNAVKVKFFKFKKVKDANGKVVSHQFKGFLKKAYVFTVPTNYPEKLVVNARVQVLDNRNKVVPVLVTEVLNLPEAELQQHKSILLPLEAKELCKHKKR